MIINLENATWVELEKHTNSKAVAILPLGAVEAHGPHLTLLTDTIISQHMSELAAKNIEKLGFTVILLPPLTYTSCEFAKNFTGTISISSDTMLALIKDIIESLLKMGIRYVIFASAHLDPNHLSVLREIANKYPENIIFPDLTKRKLAERLTDEFISGSCHAGCFETSLVLAVKPQTVRQNSLPPSKQIDLAQAIKNGAKSFNELGMDLAYCGNPQTATATEGENTYTILSDILTIALINHNKGKL